jgi:hypothetical protein
VETSVLPVLKKSARKLRMTEAPVIFCDEWSPAQVKASALMVNRSVFWASWDVELLVLELQELSTPIHKYADVF